MKLQACLISALWVAYAGAQSLTFAVAGDDRVDLAAPLFKSGLNETVARHLFTEMKKDKAEFVLWTGDLVGGVRSKLTTPLAEQLQQWKAFTEPFGIPVVPARGNHETYAEAGTSADEVWKGAYGPFIAQHQVEGLTSTNPFDYAYTPPGHPEVLCLALDEYPNHSVDAEWIKKVVAAKKPKHVFAFLHEMAFTAGGHKDNLSLDKPKRDAFVNALKDAGCKFIFAGHDHFYDHMVITKPEWNGYEIHQIIAGTAGAPFYTATEYPADGDYKLTRLKHIDNSYGYVLVKIEGDKVEVSYRGNDWSLSERDSLKIGG